MNTLPGTPSAKRPVKRRAKRPDLSASFLIRWLLGVLVGVLVVAVIVSTSGLSPATRLGQLLGIVGAALLLMPLVFSIMKRVAGAASPPTWFVVHVLCAGAGLVLVTGHAAGGQWLSPPALIFLAALFLVVQGTLARVLLGPRLGDLFAASTGSFNHGEMPAIDRQALQQVIANKRLLLQQLSPQDNEGTFSVTVSHWCRHPVLSWRYATLVREEQDLVGARRRAGKLLTLWRPLHMLIASAFLVGLLIHVIVVLFFAGYVAGDNPITWWHITDWGRP